MEQKPTGRPTDYSPAMRDAICARLAAGETLRSICRDDTMPERQTIYNWLYVNKGEVKQGEKILVAGFFDHYTRAREVGLDEICDETIEIADDGTNDFVERVVKQRGGGEKKEIVFDKEAVMRSRLRVETRNSYLANMAPRKYGRNVKVETQALDKKGEPTDPPGSAAATDSFLESVAAALKKGEAKP